MKKRQQLRDPLPFFRNTLFEREEDVREEEERRQEQREVVAEQINGWNSQRESHPDEREQQPGQRNQRQNQERGRQRGEASLVLLWDLAYLLGMSLLLVVLARRGVQRRLTD